MTDTSPLPAPLVPLPLLPAVDKFLSPYWKRALSSSVPDDVDMQAHAQAMEGEGDDVGEGEEEEEEEEEHHVLSPPPPPPQQIMLQLGEVTKLVSLENTLCFDDLLGQLTADVGEPITLKYWQEAKNEWVFVKTQDEFSHAVASALSLLRLVVEPAAAAATTSSLPPPPQAANINRPAFHFHFQDQASASSFTMTGQSVMSTRSLSPSKTKTKTGIGIVAVESPRKSPMSTRTNQSQGHAHQASSSSSISSSYGASSSSSSPSPTTQTQPQTPFTITNDTIATHPSTPHHTPLIWQRGKKLGSGAFGTVFSALDLRTGTRFAVKQVLLNTHTNNNNNTLRAKQFRALQREIHYLESLAHTHIIKILGTQRTRHRLLIFLEHASDGSLASLIEEFGPVSMCVCVRYTQQLLEGLCYLHENRIVHRDVKPANILIDKGQVKLADFGASMRLDDENNLLTQTTAGITGTLLYLPPEVLQATDGQGFSCKSDIWSLGITLVEAALGTHPFSSLEEALVTACGEEEGGGRGDIHTHTHTHVQEQNGEEEKDQGAVKSPSPPSSSLRLPPLPSFPAYYLPEAHDFLSVCLLRNPHTRWSASKLRTHPFVCMRVCVSDEEETEIDPRMVMVGERKGEGAGSRFSPVSSNEMGVSGSGCVGESPREEMEEEDYVSPRVVATPRTGELLFDGGGEGEGRGGDEEEGQERCNQYVHESESGSGGDNGGEKEKEKERGDALKAALKKWAKETLVVAAAAGGGYNKGKVLDLDIAAMKLTAHINRQNNNNNKHIHMEDIGGEEEEEEATPIHMNVALTPEERRRPLQEQLLTPQL